MMSDPLRHPVSLVLGIFRIFGGFPYRLRKIPRRRTLNITDEHRGRTPEDIRTDEHRGRTLEDIRTDEHRGRTPEDMRTDEHGASTFSAGGGEDEGLVVERNLVASLWSWLLGLLLVANNILYLHEMEYGSRDTWTVIATLVQVSLCLVAASIQLYVVLYSQDLAFVLTKMIQANVHLTGGYLRRQFLVLYLLVGTDLALSGFDSLKSATKILSSEGREELTLYLSNFLLLSMFTPVSCLGSYGLLHAVCITLKTEMEERFLQDGTPEGTTTLPCLNGCTSHRETLRHRRNTVLPVLATSPTNTASGSSGTKIQSTSHSRDLERLRRMDWKAFSCFLADVDDIVESLTTYQGLVILLVSLQTLAATVTILYGSLSDVQEDISYLNLLVLLLRLLCIVCSPDVLTRQRRRCLWLFRRLAVAPISDAEAREVERVVSVLENGPSFSVCGLFSLGRHCIIPVLSCLATYLIIAVQFHSSEVSVQNPGELQV